MRYAAILTGFVGIAALTTPAAAAEGGPSPAPGLYIRFVTMTGAAGGTGGLPASCSGASAIVSEQNQASKWPSWHPVQSMKGDIEQTLNLGSQSTGAGAGKVTYNPFSVTMAPSSLDATLVEYTASGKVLCDVDLLVVGAQGSTQLYKLRMAALKTMSWSADSRGVGSSTYTFEYGGFMIVNQTYRPDGAPGKTTAKAWNRVLNTSLTPSATDIALKQLMP